MDKPLLILDLDETLIHGSETRLERFPDFLVGPYHIYQRPHLTDFFAQVRGSYLLAVWTASMRIYAENIVKQAFPEDLKLEFFWSREHCKRRMDLETREQYWLKYLANLKGRYDLDRILAVDDDPRCFEKNYGNHVRVRPYGGSTEDRELLHLATYLEQLAPLPNLRIVEKRGWRQRFD